MQIDNTVILLLPLAFITSMMFYDNFLRGQPLVEKIIQGNLIPYLLLVIGFIFMQNHQKQTAPPKDDNLEKAILALSNEVQKMRTEAEWRSEARSQGLIL